jgi:hypothetical protein
MKEDGTTGNVFWSEGVAEAFINRWFTPNACNFCDDVFAELADITLMDAWLPEYSKDSKGTSLIIVRTPLVMSFLQDGIKNGSIILDGISLEKVMQSQIGVIAFKKKLLPFRLYMAQKRGLSIPSNRIEASKDMGILDKQATIIKMRMQEKSKFFFLNSYSNEVLDLTSFRKGMNPYLRYLERLQLLSKVSRRLSRTFKKQLGENKSYE